MPYAEITMKSGAVVRIDCTNVRTKTDVHNDITSIAFEETAGTKYQHMYVRLDEVAAVVWRR